MFVNCNVWARPWKLWGYQKGWTTENKPNFLLRVGPVASSKASTLSVCSTSKQYFLLPSLELWEYLCLTPSFLSSSCHFDNWKMQQFPLLCIIFISPIVFAHDLYLSIPQLADEELLFIEQRCSELRERNTIFFLSWRILLWALIILYH